MSGNEPAPREEDRRVRRTRRALLDAFGALVHARRYEEIRVADIVERADVGRSTFYEHYRGKDDVLVQSMAGIFDVLADAAFAFGDDMVLGMVLEHFREVRAVARHLFAGPSAAHVAPQMRRALARRIEERLAARLRERGERTVLPASLVAAHVAEGQLALVRLWLADGASTSAAELAAGLRRASAAALEALCEDAPPR